MNLKIHQVFRFISSLLFVLVSHEVVGGDLNAIMNDIRERDSRNQRIDFSLSQRENVLSYCVNNLSGEASSIDVFRVFLHVADALKDTVFDQVVLCFRGDEKYLLPGGEFGVMGREFEVQNPIYTLRTFPEKLQLPDGRQAFAKHRGGALYLMRVQMEDVNNMHRHWYLNQLIAEKEKNRNVLRPKEFSAEEDVF